MNPWLAGVLVWLAVNVVLAFVWVVAVKILEAQCTQWEEDEVHRIASDDATLPDDELPANWQKLDTVASFNEAWAEMRRRKTGGACGEARSSALCEQAMRKAILAADGKSDAAYERFNLWIIRENNAVLERELSSAYRSSAIRALLAEQFTALRSEGKIPRPGDAARIPTTDYERPRNKWRPGEGVNQDLRPSAQEMNRALILNSFKINGQAIGDCTVTEAENAASRSERDARFIRFIVAGLPLVGKIRDYHSDEEASALWAKANEGYVILESPR